MPATFTFSGMDAIQRRMDPKNTMDRIEAAVDDAAQKGKEVMREAVETRGTGKTWKSPWFGREGSYPGRVDSGDMLDGIDGKVTSRNSRTVEGTLGWDDDAPMYVALQDNGFRHVLTGQDVEGMMALRDGADVARRSLVADIEEIASDV